MNFTLEKTQVIVENTNFRKQNEGDRKVLASDLKMRATVPISALSTLLGDDGIDDALYTADGELRFPGIETFSIGTEPMDLKLIVFFGVKDDVAEFNPVTLKGFVVEPKRDRVCQVTFTAQFDPGNKSDLLAHLIREPAYIAIQPLTPGLFDGGEG